MTRFALLLLAPAALVACTPTTSTTPTAPHAYECEGAPVTVSSAQITRAASLPATLEIRDGAVDRYLAHDGDDLVEYTVPHNPMLDATMVRYRAGDRAHPAARATCIAHGGYSDALRHYVRAQSTHQVALELQLDDDAAEERIFQGWYRLGKRFRTER